MPSRKRIKGKARKAKVASLQAQQLEQERLQQNHKRELKELVDEVFRKDENRCDHGFVEPSTKEDAIFCHSFMDNFIETSYLGLSTTSMELLMVNISSMVKLTLSSHMGSVYADEDRRKMIVPCLESLGALCLLQEESRYTNMAAIVAMTAIQVEYADNQMTDNKMISMMFDLGNDTEREATRFFAKRLECSCLKTRYQKLRSQPKMGCCVSCKVRKERKDLLQCSRCKEVEYCSVDCQRKAWAKHREICKPGIKFQTQCRRVIDARSTNQVDRFIYELERKEKQTSSQA